MSPIRTFQGMYVNKNIPWNVKSDKILFFSVFLLPEMRPFLVTLKARVIGGRTATRQELDQF